MPFQEEIVPQKRGADAQNFGAEQSLPRMIYQDLRNVTQKTINVPKNLWLWVFIIFCLVIYTMAFSVFMVKSGYMYIYDNVLTGKLDVYKKPGIHFKFPFSPVTSYKQVWIVDFGTGYEGDQVRRQKAPITLRFADSYKANIPATFRYKLPTADERIAMIHKDFTTQEKLIDALLIPISRNLMVSTATQYTGEEFMQGGLNQFRDALEDQLQYGIYKTERKLFSRERDWVAIGSGTDTKTTILKIWKTVPIKGDDGKIERLKKKSLVDYGIEVIQVTLGVPVPAPDLEQLLADKKRFDRLSNEKAEELVLDKDDEKLLLAKQAKAHKLRLEAKAEDLDIFREEHKLRLEKKAAELDIEREEEKILLARKDKELAIELATTKARKVEELLIAQENEKIELAKQVKAHKLRLAKKAEELAIEKEDEKFQQAKQTKELAVAQKQLEIVQADLTIQKTQQEEALAIEVAVELARKEAELILELEDEKIQLAKQAKAHKLSLAKQAEQLAVAQKQLEIVQAELAIQKTQKEEELAIEVAITKAKKAEELIIAQANMEIQKANFEATQFEVKATREKGIVEAEILKAIYEARRPEIYLAEIQKEIAAIIYPNLMGVQVTMPHNIITLGGDKDNPLLTNLDVLSSFATLGVMEQLHAPIIPGQGLSISRDKSKPEN